MTTLNKYIILIFLFSFAFRPILFSQCNFTSSASEICAGETLLLDVINPDNANDYEWDLDGDGNLDTSGVSIAYETPPYHVDTTISISLFSNGTYCNTTDIQFLAVPDPSIGVPPGIVVMIGNSIKACNGSNSFDLQIFNNSQTFDDNSEYIINWGDGSPAETHDNSTFNNTSTLTHTYVGLGYYPIFISATHSNGCVYTQSYTFYNGGNPSVGIAIPGNTVGLCAPATLDFPIINAENNPPGTEYSIFVNGEEVANYNQENLPPTFTYTFEESSCGQTTSTGNYPNAFDMQIVASNPCNSSTATIEPIEVSSPPTPYFEVTPPPSICPGADFVFTDQSSDVNEVIAGSPSSCIDVLNPSWTISGQNGQDWMLVSGNLFGSSEIEVEFLEPGVYTITMTIVSFACGPFIFSQEIVIEEAPIVSADFDLEASGMASGGCAPFDLPLFANATGEITNYEWNIFPEEGWQFTDSISIDSSETMITFLEGGMYTIQLSATNACATTSWDTLINILGIPEVDITPLEDFCESASLSFDASNISYFANGNEISSYNWDFIGSNTTSSNEQYPTDIQYDAPGEYIITLTVENSCGTSSISDTFQIQEQTALEMPPNLEICASETPITLTPNPMGGEWQGTGVNSNGTFDPSIANVGANMLNYTFGVDACLVEDFMTITVLPAPEVEVNPNQEICQNEATFTLSANVPNGTWYQNENQALNTTTIAIDSLLPGIHLYWYNVENDLGCIGSDTVELTILTIPEIIVPDSSYCNTPGNVFLPNAQPSGGTWSGLGVTDPLGSFDPIAAGGSGIYVLTYAFAANNGCNVIEEVEIGVIAPEIVDAGPHQNFCQSAESLSLDNLATPPGGNWISPDIGSPGLPDPMSLSPGNYQFIYSVGTGNCLVEDSLQVNILPIPEVSAGPDLAFCPEEGNTTFDGFSPIGGIWEGANITGNTVDFSTLTEGTYNYTYTIIDPITECSNTDNRQLTIHPIPDAEMELPDQACVETSINMSNLSNGAIAYEWTIDNEVTINTFSPNFVFESDGIHQIALTATNSFGCQSNTLDSLFIIGFPDAAFITSSSEDCGELMATFENTSEVFEGTYIWDFGNGTTSTITQPNDTLLFEGTETDVFYTVTLNATNQCGTDTWSDTLWVRAFPIADFGFTVDTGCSPLSIEFNNISLGSEGEFLWDFGNGTTSTDSLPEAQVYVAIDSIMEFPVSLIYSNICGVDTLEQTVVVEPEEITAFFNINSTEGCAPFDVSLENFASPGTQVQWNFGDGNFSGELNPSYTFAEAGTYQITQVISNSCATDSTSIMIEVLPSPELDFETTPNLCSGQEINFQNHSNNLASLIWDFGDGMTSTISNPIHTYATTGTYTIHLFGTAMGSECTAEITQEIDIIEPPIAQFDLDRFNGCTPFSFQIDNQSQGGFYYQWDFGDGNSSIAQNPSHTYLEDGHYEITLTVTDEIGCQAETIFGNIFAFPVPEANFEIQTESDCGIPQTVVFNNLSSNAEGFLWQMGEQLNSNIVNPIHTYTQSGQQLIHLVATNQYGCQDSMEQTLRLYETPVAEFEIDSLEGCQDLRAHFQNYSTGNQFFWDFGDGNTSSEISPEHIYFDAGEYDVQLVSAFDDVCFDTLHLESLVNVWPKPKADFRWEENLINGVSTGDLSFVNLSQDANSYLWDFGTSNTSTEENPSYRFERNGIWEVQLTAFSNEGCVDDTLMIIPHDLVKGLFIPNAFSPLDGIGETTLFMPKGIGLKEYRVQIYSPYGQLLWESTKLENGEPLEGWDGRLNGELLPQDVYVWKVNAIFDDQTNWRGQKIKGGKYKRMGSVTLLR